MAGASTTIDISGTLTALLAIDFNAAPGPPRAFRWSPSGMVNVTTDVVPYSGIDIIGSQDFMVADFNGGRRPDAFLATNSTESILVAN